MRMLARVLAVLTRRRDDEDLEQERRRGRQE